MKVSRALVAAAIFLAINIAIPASANLKAGGATSLAGDTIQKALRQAQQKLVAESAGQRPVVFIGSSLIIAPLWSTDVKQGYFFKDCMLHHESKAFEKILQKDGLSAPVVSLATAGQFVSDTYLIIDKFFGNLENASTSGSQVSSAARPGQKQSSCIHSRLGRSANNQIASNQPLALIYGVAPRDFMDDTTGGLALSSVFDELVEATDLPKISQLFFSSFGERADFVLNRTVYMYRKRGRYQNKFQESFEKTVARTMHDQSLASKNGTQPGGANDPLAGFLMGGNRNDIWTKSINEYSRRYKFFNKEQFDKQKECFKAVVALCQKKGIKLYVVAMPVTEDNLKLMPNSLYSSYLDCLTSTTAAGGVPFIDLQKSGQYHNDDFYDTVHLNGIGGERFLAAMSDLVVNPDRGAITASGATAGATSGATTGAASRAAAAAAGGASLAATKKVSSPTY